jgi:hypothetical protein
MYIYVLAILILELATSQPRMPPHCAATVRFSFFSSLSFYRAQLLENCLPFTRSKFFWNIFQLRLDLVCLNSVLRKLLRWVNTCGWIDCENSEYISRVNQRNQKWVSSKFKYFPVFSKFQIHGNSDKLRPRSRECITIPAKIDNPDRSRYFHIP